MILKTVLYAPMLWGPLSLVTGHYARRCGPH
jgi:hypothetical protein